MSACIFCRIVAGEAPASIVHRDEQVLAFRDIAPKAPTHILVIPLHHIESAADLTGADRDWVGHLLITAAQIAAQAGLHDGYRLVLNTGRHGGQSVDHLHVHILGGRYLHWPPG